MDEEADEEALLHLSLEDDGDDTVGVAGGALALLLLDLQGLVGGGAGGVRGEGEVDDGVLRGGRGLGVLSLGGACLGVEGLEVRLDAAEVLLAEERVGAHAEGVGAGRLAPPIRGGGGWRGEDSGGVGEDGEDLDLHVVADEAVEHLELEAGVVVEELSWKEDERGLESDGGDVEGAGA